MRPAAASSAGLPRRRGRPGWTRGSSGWSATRGGPLLVLAGPGTGKTTAIVEAVADRVIRRGADPGRVLVLTFSRKAAGELRERITRPAGPDHPRAAGADLPQLRVRPGAQGVRAGRRRAAAAAVGARAPGRDTPGYCAARPGTAAAGGRPGCAPRSAPGVSPRSCATCCSAPPSAAWTAARWPRSARAAGGTTGSPPGRFLDRYAARFDLAPVPAYDYAEIIRIAAQAARPRRRPRAGNAGPTTSCWWTSTRTPIRRRRRCCTRWPGTAAS